METAPTPGPWSVWQLAPDSDQQERQIITTADGETEITGITSNPADAALIVKAVNAHADLIQAVRALLNCPAMNEDSEEPETRRAIDWSKAILKSVEGAE